MPFRTSTSTYLQKANFHPQIIFLAYELITQTNILLTKQRTFVPRGITVPERNAAAFLHIVFAMYPPVANISPSWRI